MSSDTICDVLLEIVTPTTSNTVAWRMHKDRNTISTTLQYLESSQLARRNYRGQYLITQEGMDLLERRRPA